MSARPTAQMDFLDQQIAERTAANPQYPEILEEAVRARYVAGSQTSQAAALSIRDKAPTLRQRVMEFLATRRFGATDEEIQIALRMNPSTERPRRIELCEAGLVFDIGERRPTQSGRAATVWYAPFTGEVAEGPAECSCTEYEVCAACHP